MIPVVTGLCHPQSAPGIIFTLFAGPLTDTYGRKPLIISALLGYLLLDIIFLVNSIWFYDLKVIPARPSHFPHNSGPQVEYLLLECLQDLTGGASAFYLACYSLMVDITSPGSRTRRLSFLDSFMPIGFLIGLPLGVYIKNNYGYITVFSIAACIMLTCILYVIFVLKEKKKIVDKSEESEDDELKITLDKSTKPEMWVCCLFSFIFLDCLNTVGKMTVAGVRTIFKKRKHGERAFIICFATIFILSKGIDSGAGTVTYLFYRMQYKLDDTTYSNLGSLYTILMLVCQVGSGDSLTQSRQEGSAQSSHQHMFRFFWFPS